MNYLLIFATTFFAIMKIIIVAFGGFVLAKKGLFHKQVTKDMGKIIFSFMVPCLIFGNIIKSVDVDRAKNVGLLVLFPLVTHIIAFMLGHFLRLILRYKEEEEEYLLVVAGSTFGNHGNIAVPLFGAILSDPKGPFSDVPDAYKNGVAYVMIYMSMSSVIIWGVGMPWFRRRNQRKLKRQTIIEMQPSSTSTPKDIVAAEKAQIQGDVIVTPAGIPYDPSKQLAHTDSKSDLLLHADTDDGVGEYRPDGPPTEHVKARFIRILTSVRKSYFFEILTLPPVFAMSTALLIAFIPPVRSFLLNTYASIIPNTAAFVGDASIPIIIMFLGSNLAENSKNNVVIPKRLTFSVVFTRLIVLPTVGISLVYGLIRLDLLPDDIVLKFLIMLQFAMPAAVNLILACQIAGGGEAKMSALLFWQYVFCSVTVSFFCIVTQLILL